jgi:hypothetical protein
VSFSGCTPVLFSINNCSDGQFCSFRLQCPKLKTKVGQISSSRHKSKF